MVWHHATSAQIEGKFGLVVLEQASKLEVVIVGPENPAEINPGRDYVIETSCDFNPWFTRRRG